LDADHPRNLESFARCFTTFNENAGFAFKVFTVLKFSEFRHNKEGGKRGKLSKNTAKMGVFQLK